MTSLPYPILSQITPLMMMPKQNPGNPAPPIAPSCAPEKPNSAPQLSKIPPRMAKPTPAARMAMNPPQRRRLALEVMPSVFADMSNANEVEVGVRLKLEKKPPSGRRGCSQKVGTPQEKTRQLKARLSLLAMPDGDRLVATFGLEVEPHAEVEHEHDGGQDRNGDENTALA